MYIDPSWCPDNCQLWRSLVSPKYIEHLDYFREFCQVTCTKEHSHCKAIKLGTIYDPLLAPFGNCSAAIVRLLSPPKFLLLFQCFGLLPSFQVPWKSSFAKMPMSDGHHCWRISRSLWSSRSVSWCCSFWDLQLHFPRVYGCFSVEALLVYAAQYHLVLQSCMQLQYHFPGVHGQILDRRPLISCIVNIRLSDGTIVRMDVTPKSKSFGSNQRTECIILQYIAMLFVLVHPNIA